MKLLVQSHARSVRRLLPVVALAACGLVACGSSDDSETTTGGATAGSSGSEAATATTTAATSAATSADAGGATTSAAGDGATGGSGESITMADVATKVGTGGADCWIVVENVVYDATGNPQWKDGTHGPSGGKATCGKDLTEVIGESPHGKSVLDGLPQAGALTSS